MYRFSEMKVSAVFLLVLCILSIGFSVVESQRLSQRLERFRCVRRSCRRFSPAHREGCCQLYNSCCSNSGWCRNWIAEVHINKSSRPTRTPSVLYLNLIFVHKTFHIYKIPHCLTIKLFRSEFVSKNVCLYFL